MYFDIDHQVELMESRRETVLDSTAREITARRGRVIALSRDILVFAAPFWRVNGLLSLFAKQLPLGVSQGVFQVVATGAASAVRFRVSLLWLRLNIAAIVMLLVSTVLRPDARAEPLWWTLLLASIVAGGVLYAVALIATRRFFARLLRGDQDTQTSQRRSVSKEARAGQ